MPRGKAPRSDPESRSTSGVGGVGESRVKVETAAVGESLSAARRALRRREVVVALSPALAAELERAGLLVVRTSHAGYELPFLVAREGETGR
jgi:hypothetical protein